MNAVRSKMATLKAKLQEAEAHALEAEEELLQTNGKADATEEKIQELNNFSSDLEDKLDEAESKLISLQEKLNEAEKFSDEHTQAHKILENRGKSDNTRLCSLEEEQASLVVQNLGLQEKFELVSVSLAEMEEGYDEEEERCETSDARVKELEVEVTQIGNSLRSMEINEGQAVERSEGGDSKISVMREKYESMEARAMEYEQKTADREAQYDDAEEELAKAKDKYNSTKQDLDNLLAEIAEM